MPWFILRLDWLSKIQRGCPELRSKYLARCTSRCRHCVDNICPSLKKIAHRGVSLFLLEEQQQKSLLTALKSLYHSAWIPKDTCNSILVERVDFVMEDAVPHHHNVVKTSTFCSILVVAN